MSTHSKILNRIWGNGWIVLALALTIRLVYLVQYYDSPFFRAPIWDAADYHKIAVAFSQAEISPVLAYRTPLYPIFLGLIYMVFGVSDLIPRLVQILIGSLSCVIVMKIAERIYNKETATLAGVVAALTGLMVYFDLELLPTTLVVFLSLLFILELIKICDKQGSHLKAGLWFTLAALTRPVILTFLPAVIIWLFLRDRKYLHILKFLVPAVALLGISFMAHLLSGSGPVLISAQGGVNFYMGNHHNASGATASFPGSGTSWGWIEMRGWAERKTGRQMLNAEIDRFYWSQGFDEIKNHPGAWLKLMGRKAILFFNRIEIPSNRDLNYHGKRFPLIGILMWFGFPLLLPLALTGIVTGWRRSEIKLLSLYMVIFFLTGIMFFVNGRFRHPLTALFIVLASGAVAEIYRIIRSGRWKDYRIAAPVSIAIVIGLILPNLIDFRKYYSDETYGLITEGKAYEMDGQDERAESFYLKALETDPESRHANFLIAELARNRHDFHKAARYYSLELDKRPGYVRAWNNLGVVWMELEEDENARACFEQALKIQPDMSEAAVNLARIWGMHGLKASETGDWESALQSYKIAISLQSGNPLFKTMFLEARFRLGDETTAKESLQALLKVHPNFQPALTLLDEMKSE